MKYFEIETELKLTNVNVRAEQHGEDHVTGVDLTFTGNFDEGVLDLFAIDAIDWPFWDDKGELRHHGVDAIVFNREWEDLPVTLRYGVKDQEPIAFGPSKVKKFVAKPQPGARFELSFVVQGNPKKDDIGDIAELQQELVRVRIERPAQMDLKDEVGPDGVAA